MEDPSLAEVLTRALLSFAVTPLLGMAVFRHRAAIPDRSLGEQQVEEELTAFAKPFVHGIVASLFSSDGITAPLELSRTGVGLVLDRVRIASLRSNGWAREPERIVIPNRKFQARGPEVRRHTVLESF